ncbi:hypothetical protein GCM10010116_22900 [Microbispora rosea subsp. aerata]|nr:hypothetical protein GCM10010116_22900 [Microbispora rosea subsp. aerata]GIH55781.1 hypothetical protein Mro02_26950 [Microbispora rosea subsp. aerata]GLJ85921.1 hypothetical protein GCM10017588_46540 [Microbispora rosea subsp. aerata]
MDQRHDLTLLTGADGVEPLEDHRFGRAVPPDSPDQAGPAMPVYIAWLSRPAPPMVRSWVRSRDRTGQQIADVRVVDPLGKRQQSSYD